MLDLIDAMSPREIARLRVTPVPAKSCAQMTVSDSSAAFDGPYGENPARRIVSRFTDTFTIRTEPDLLRTALEASVTALGKRRRARFAPVAPDSAIALWLRVAQPVARLEPHFRAKRGDRLWLGPCNAEGDGPKIRFDGHAPGSRRRRGGRVQLLEFWLAGARSVVG